MSGMSREARRPSSSALVVGLSLALLLFSVPHVLEDFAAGEPAKQGVPAPVLAFVVSALLVAQGAGLYWLGRGRRRGLALHLVLGVVWPLAAGVAQVPTLVTSGEPYRSGAISVTYVVGIIAVGAALFVASAIALRAPRPGSA